MNQNNFYPITHGESGRDENTAVLFINLGTPKSTSLKDVALYLRQFLTDWRVISLPWIMRQLLVLALIIPSRLRTSRKNYRSIWMNDGSPLMVYSKRFMNAIEKRLKEKGITPFLAMRYQEPSMHSVLEKIRAFSPSSLTVIPLYPQYASATTGSSIEALMHHMHEWKAFPSLQVITSFYNEPFFIRAWSEKIKAHATALSSSSKILFCFHGLPQKQVIETKPKGPCCFSQGCCKDPVSLHSCYVAQCKKTAELLAKEVQLPEERWEIVFQSRLGKDEWTTPYISERLAQLPQEGIDTAIIVSASFVVDCIETIEELGQECKEIFLSHGGKEFTLIDSLNDDEVWISHFSEYIFSITK